MNYKFFMKRYIVMIIAIILVGIIFFGRLIDLQIINGADYEVMALKKSANSSVVKAPRGEILDRYGRALVTNRMAFSVVIDKVRLGKNDLNTLIYNLMDIFDKNEVEYTDSLPISLPPYEYTFDFFEKNGGDYNKIEKIIKAQKLKEDASAQQIMDTLKKKYSISAQYDEQTARKIAGMRYEMESRSFSSNNPFVFGQDVDMDLVTQIKENQQLFVGTEISVEPIREYVAGQTAAHILGRIGPIYKEDYEALKEKGYLISDVVGKEGIEKAFEDYLKGTNGRRSLEQNPQSQMLDSVYIQEPIPGNNIVLTIDKDIQEVAEASLAKTIQSIAASGKAQGSRVGSGYDAAAGAAVVIDIHSGEILAIASYPTYNPATFNADYRELEDNPAQPIFNRAIAGTYEPGSTFKMLTALAGLETGVIDTNTSIVCKGIYTHYAPSYSPKCWVYEDYGRTHGALDVEGALTVSCNYFFYETARLMGIEKLNEYGRKVGFGDYTGIEIAGEKKGILAGREYRDDYNRPWYDGDTLQAAIGQSDNQITPLQLANYVATIVNGGTRFKAHLLKQVTDYNTGKEVYSKKPEIADQINMNQSTYDAIMNGMRKVTEHGTASNVFSNYEISVGGKTGTATSGVGKTANGVFVAFAPFENPEIAVAVIVEQGAHGNTVAPVAKDIFDVYFDLKENKIGENQN